MSLCQRAHALGGHVPAHLDVTHRCTLNICDTDMVTHACTHRHTHETSMAVLTHVCMFQHICVCTHTHILRARSLPFFASLTCAHPSALNPKAHRLRAAALTSQVRPGHSGCALLAPCTWSPLFASQLLLNNHVISCLILHFLLEC